MTKNKKVALCLASGGSRGMAHIGAMCNVCAFVKNIMQKWRKMAVLNKKLYKKFARVE